MGRRFKGTGTRDLSVKNSICNWMQRQRKAMARVSSKDRSDSDHIPTLVNMLDFHSIILYLEEASF
jgi:hypothetical protein